MRKTVGSFYNESIDTLSIANVSSSDRVCFLIPTAVESPAIVRVYRTIARILKNFNIIIIGNLNDIAPGSIITPLRYLRQKVELYKKLFLTASHCNVLLILYPYPIFRPFDSRARGFELTLWKWVGRRVDIVAYVFDLPIFQTPSRSMRELKKAVEAEKAFFDNIKVAMAFNEEMCKYLKKIGVEKCVTYEMLDDLSPETPRLKPLGRPVTIVLAGSLRRDVVGPLEHLGRCGNVCKYIFFGNHGRWLLEFNREDFDYRGFVDPDKLSLGDFDFGLLVYSQQRAPYLRFGHGDKFTTYISRGLPVITTRNLSYPSQLVAKYQVGLIVDDISQIPDLVQKVSEDYYLRLRSNVLNLARRLKTGFFFKRAFLAALRELTT